MEGWESCFHQTKIAQLRRGKRAWDHGNIAESGLRVSGPGKSVACSLTHHEGGLWKWPCLSTSVGANWQAATSDCLMRFMNDA